MVSVPMHNRIICIEIFGLWGKFDLRWDLSPRVNVLSGLNGSGKSTTLHALACLLRGKSFSDEELQRVRSVAVTFDDGSTLSSESAGNKPVRNVDVISTFDSRLKDPDALQKLSEGEVRTEIDWEIYRLQKRYITYQLAQGKKIISLLTCHAPQSEIEAINNQKTEFFDLVDSLLGKTHKTSDRTSDELSFLSDDGTRLSPYMLSAGEKQLLLILATALTQDSVPSILLMDEPDISMHFDWQTSLLENVLKINPNAQLIVSTHSPALVMNGWLDTVSEVSDLVVKRYNG
ncbi:MAG: ATP-binding protein [Rikenellaceae bacterium]|jgi:predicted ATP-dependent endonuclease of OLD family|nr:ATP-binding protein [Rikenellaceae bacterium]